MKEKILRNEKGEEVIDDDVLSIDLVGYNNDRATYYRKYDEEQRGRALREAEVLLGVAGHMPNYWEGDSRHEGATHYNATAGDLARDACHTARQIGGRDDNENDGDGREEDLDTGFGGAPMPRD